MKCLGSRGKLKAKAADNDVHALVRNVTKYLDQVSLNDGRDVSCNHFICGSGGVGTCGRMDDTCVLHREDLKDSMRSFSMIGPMKCSLFHFMEQGFLHVFSVSVAKHAIVELEEGII